jgi:hypothetical protein
VEAGLATTCESYAYSSLSRLLGFRKINFPIETDTILLNPDLQIEALHWLNSGKSDLHQHVAFALKKRVFRYRKNIGNRTFLLDPETIY